LPQHFISELRHFFEEYKTLENKAVVVEEFLEKKIAQTILNESLVMYKDML
jgi:inorganic pyrophosphatase